MKTRTLRRSLALVLAGWFSLAATCGWGHEDHEHDHEHPAPLRVADEVAHRPSAIPDRILLTWSGDPATTQAVNWRTDATVHKSLAQLAKSDGGPRFMLEAVDHPAQTSALQTDLGLAHYHSVIFTGLTPGSKYVYRVGDGENWSEWFQFRTAQSEPAPFSFIYFGDAQNEIKSHWSRVVREAFTDAPKASFLLHAGDLINNANSDAQWGEWFAAGGWLNGMTPTIAAPGNHEYARDEPTPAEEEQGVTPPRLLSRHWRPQFAFPENGPAGIDDLKETVYYIDYQGARIVVLNSNERQAEQAEWLDRVLSDNPHRWTIVSHHHPIHSAARDRDNPALRAIWQPIYDKHRVDLVLQGHDHTYGRSGLLSAALSEAMTKALGEEKAESAEEAKVGAINAADGLRVQDAEAGVTYVVSVSGPKLYYMTRERKQFFSRAGEGLQLYQVISINGDSLRYEARTASGELYDGFTLKKRPGEVNELIEQIPDTPPRYVFDVPADEADKKEKAVEPVGVDTSDGKSDAQ